MERVVDAFEDDVSVNHRGPGGFGGVQRVEHVEVAGCRSAHTVGCGAGAHRVADDERAIRIEAETGRTAGARWGHSRPVGGADDVDSTARNGELCCCSFLAGSAALDALINDEHARRGSERNRMSREDE